ncbi:MAG: EthD family reductase [Chloroflexota bacterium]|nr:MAG: EthD family reductase [Chloroflexota bacterium]
MHKLVIMIEEIPNEAQFDETWPEFLHVSERMPGLVKEATCRVESSLYGSVRPILVHELYFDSLDELRAAMSSPEGRSTGELLQQMTAGRINLFIADHKEDLIENIQSFQHNENNAAKT